jgi:hypothetical protein
MTYDLVRHINFPAEVHRPLIGMPDVLGTQPWTVRVLELVNQSCRTWALIRVPGEQLGEVLLGWHVSKVDLGSPEVVPREGMLVNEVVSEPYYGRIQRNAPKFVEKLAERAQKPLGHIFLSGFIPRSEGTYEKVVERPGHLLCLDGLNRLIAYAKVGLLPRDQVEVTAALR